MQNQIQRKKQPRRRPDDDSDQQLPVQVNSVSQAVSDEAQRLVDAIDTGTGEPRPN
jgi:hypothetical protein